MFFADRFGFLSRYEMLSKPMQDEIEAEGGFKTFAKTYEATDINEMGGDAVARFGIEGEVAHADEVEIQSLKRDNPRKKF